MYIHASKYCHLNHFVKSEFTGRFIYFQDKYPDPYAGVAFGLIGSAVSNKRRGIVLDTSTGKVIHLNDDTMLTLLSDFPDLKQSYASVKRRKLAVQKLFIMKLNEKYAASN